MLISDMIGSVDSFGGTIKKGLPYQKRVEALRQASERSRGVKIRRATSEEIEMIPSHFRAGILRLIEQLEQSNKLTIVMGRDYDKGSRRLINDEHTIEFDPQTGEAEVAFGVALVLLSRDRYQRLVREVGASDVTSEPAPRISMTPSERRDFEGQKRRMDALEAALAEKLALLDAKLSALDAAPKASELPLSEAPEPENEPSAPRRRSSKKRG